MLEGRRQQGRIVHRLTGSAAFTEMPFAAVAALSAQITGQRQQNHPPLEMIASIAALSAGQAAPGGSPRTLFLDRAELVDAHSAAAIVQLAELGVFELICAATGLNKLPADLQRMSFEHGATRLTLGDISLDDTLVLLEGTIGAPFDASSAARLRAVAGSNPLLVRELATEAHMSAVLQQHRGYLSLPSAWQPSSSRVSSLLRARLGQQPAGLREAVELVAVVGELPVAAARRLITESDTDRALHERLLTFVTDAGSESGTLELGAGLAPVTVVAAMDKPTLAARIKRLREEVPPELLTSNMRVQLATNSRSAGFELNAEELVADAETAALARQFDAVIALTDVLERDPAGDGLADAAAAIGPLRMYRAEAFLETGAPNKALKVLEPLLAEDDLDARLFASYIEFSGLGRPDLMSERLTVRPGDAPEVAALRAILCGRAGGPVSIETLQRHAADERLTHRLRLSTTAQLVVERSHLGHTQTALDEFARARGGPLWERSPASQRGELMHALLVAIQSDGAAEHEYAHLFEGIDWKQLSLDQATFLAAKGLQLLETGYAAPARDLFDQASTLLVQRDPHLLAPFIAALEAVASIMLGDTERAAASYTRFCEGSVTSGQVVRFEAKRLSLAVVQAVEGDDSARALLNEQLGDAVKSGREHLRMRLLHEAWRLRVTTDIGALGAAAERLQGSLAQTLGRYTEAFGEQSDTSAQARDAALDQVITEHLASGRLLYAAEAAARGAELAKARGEWRRATQLLDACAAAAEPLVGVQTPSLRRARIDQARLSEREYEVCLRAAAGLSNAEIAEQLFLSPRTVEGHLQRAYGKLGVTDRRMLLPSEL